MAEAGMVLTAKASDVVGVIGSLPWEGVTLPRALIVRLMTYRSFRSAVSASRASWTFRCLMVGSSISMLGSRISTVAFPLLVLHLYNSPFIAGVVACAVVLPSMLTYIPAGSLVDRWDPWRVMLGSEILRGIAVACIVFSVLLVPTGRVSVCVLVSAMVAEEILEIFWMLADRRLMSQLMKQGDIADGQASIEVRSHATVLAGRPIGTFLFALKQFLPFPFDAVSFIFSILVLILLRDIRMPVASGRQWRLWHEIGEGFGWLRKDQRAWIAMALMSFMTLISQALIMMFLAEAHDKKLSAVAIAMVLAASGAGGAIGAAVAKRLPEAIKQDCLLIQVWAWSVALALLALTGVKFSWCIAIVMLLLGFTGSISNTQFGAYLVKNAGGKLARVTSVGQVMVIGACAAGPFLGGSAIQWLGLQGAIILFTVSVTVAAVAASCLGLVRRGHWLAGLRLVFASESQAGLAAVHGHADEPGEIEFPVPSVAALPQPHPVTAAGLAYGLIPADATRSSLQGRQRGRR